jgi:hypothetical protein
MVDKKGKNNPTKDLSKKRIISAFYKSPEISGLFYFIYTFMRYIYIFLFLALISSCKEKKFKYKIEGYYELDNDLVYVIAYADSIHGSNDACVWYYNSNGVKVEILKPCKIQELK